MGDITGGISKAIFNLLVVLHLKTVCFHHFESISSSIQTTNSLLYSSDFDRKKRKNLNVLLTWLKISFITKQKMDFSVVASVGSFVMSERILKPKATALFILGCVLAYDLTTKTHDVSSLRIYRGTKKKLHGFSCC